MKLRHVVKGQFAIIFALGGILFVGAGFVRGFKSSGHDMVTFLLLFISFCLPVACCLKKTEEAVSYKYDIFQPGTIMAIFFYIYVVIPSVHVWYNLDYVSNWIALPPYARASTVNYTILVSCIGLFCFGVGYRNKIAKLFVASKLRRLPDNVKHRVRSHDRFLKSIAFVLIGIGLFARLAIISKVGGLSIVTLEYLSPSLRAAKEIELSGILHFLSSFLDWGALFLFFRYIVTKRSGLLATLLMLFALISVYVLGGKRSDIVPFLLFPVIWYHYLREKIGFSRALVCVLLVFVFMASLMFARSIIAFSHRAPDAVSEVTSEIIHDPLNVYLNSPEFAVFDMSMASIVERNNIVTSIGGWFEGVWTCNFAPTLYLVPRFLWAEKPVFEDLGQVMYRLFVDDAEHVGLSVGIIGGLYIFGGLIGLCVGMMVIGVLCRAIYLTLQPYKSNPARVLMYSMLLWIIFMFLRFGTLGFTIIFVIQKLLIGIAVTCLLLYFQRRSLRRQFLLSKPSL
jgi:oligosaccharide repeat unit polymerase